MVGYVYDFAEGDEHRADLFGGRGAALAGMVRLGVPVPPGFTITTEAGRFHRATGGLPPESLVSVRPDAAPAVPGTTATVLDVGLTDASVRGLADRTGDERFAWDSYRRLIDLFGRAVCGVPGAEFGSVTDIADPRDLVTEYKRVFHAHTGRDFPQARTNNCTWPSAPPSGPGTRR